MFWDVREASGRWVALITTIVSSGWMQALDLPPFLLETLGCWGTVARVQSSAPCMLTIWTTVQIELC
jgi:hypothetical protein